MGLPERIDADYDVSLAAWAVRLDGIPGLAFEIGERLANRESWREIARQLGVRRGQLRMWMEADPKRMAACGADFRACADDMMVEALEIADTVEEGETVKEKGDGSVEVTRGDMIAHRKLKIETRQWAASVYDAPKFGKAGAGVSVTVQQRGEVDVTDLARRMAFLLAKGVHADGRDAVTIEHAENKELQRD